MNPLPSGIIAVLATPFDSDGGIDERSFARQIEDCVTQGVAAVAMFGLASEYYKLSDTERDRLARLTVHTVRGRVPVILSVTPHARKIAIAEARRFADEGADALMLMPPFFLHPSEQDVLGHAGAVAEAVDLPVILQYAPVQTSRNIGTAAFAALAADRPNLAGIKVDMVPAAPYVSALKQACSGRLHTYVGYMGLDLPDSAEAGVDGCMPTASVAPLFLRLWDLLRFDPVQGRAMHAAALPAIEFMMQSVEFLIACEKRLLAQRGIFQAAHGREPSVWLDDAQEAKLAELAQLLALDPPIVKPDVTGASAGAPRSWR